MHLKRNSVMVYPFRKWFWVSALLTASAFAQSGDAGTTSLFMETGQGARAQAMGRAFVALADDGSAVFWNPAGLDYLKQSNFIAYHSTLISGAYYNFASVAFPFIEFGSFGVGLARIGVDGIPINDVVNLVQVPLGEGTYSEEEAYISYGKRLPWFGLALGTTFKIVHITASSQGAAGGIATQKGISTGMDVGLMWRPDFENAVLRNLSFGANFQNVIAPGFTLNNREYNDPRVMRFGLAKDFFFGSDQLKKLTVTGDVVKGSRSKPEINAGLELSLSRYLVARGGMDNGKMAMGIGTEFTQFQRFQVDYAVNIGNQFGTPLHRLALTVNFGKSVEERQNLARANRLEEDQKLIVKNQEEARLRTIKEQTLQGEQLLRDRKLVPALVSLEQVVSMDPNNDRAKILLDSVRFLMDQQLATQLADTANQMRDLTVAAENRKFVEDHYRKGYANIEKGDYLAAISEFQTALDRAPKNTDIQKAIGDTRGLLDKKIAGIIARARSSAAGNNFAEALKLLSEARGLDPTNQSIQREIDTELKRISNRLSFLEATRSGLDAYQKGEYQTAMQEFEKALLIDPSNETVREYHKKSIVRAFATFKSLEGEVEKTYLQGVDLYVEGKYEAAIGIWQKILEKDPLNKRVLKAIDKAEEQIRAREEIKKNRKPRSIEKNN